MIFEIKDASFTYPGSKEPTFQHLSFGLDAGEVMTILGKNGIGKTTLVKCLTGIHRFSQGSILIDGKEVVDAAALKDISFVPQTRGMVFPYSVFDVVLMGRTRKMGLLSIPSRSDREATMRILEEMGISHLSDRRCDELSGGQMQMAYIARALVGEPRILVMDEPESALDFKNQHFILRLVERLSKERGIACIINTHYPDHALQISQKTLLMGEGVFSFGNTEDVIVEENMDEYFEVRSAIPQIEVEGEMYKTFFVVGARDKKQRRGV